MTLASRTMPMRPVASLFAILLLAACSAPPTDAPTDAKPPTQTGGEDAPRTEPAAPDTNRGPDQPATATQGAQACDWTQRALPEHRAQIEATSPSLLQGFEADSADGDRLVALLARPAQAPGDIVGAWRVRSLQLHDGNVYAYPFFQARIDADACGYRFAKTTGSQRRSGVLHAIADAPERLAFLGAATVNDDPPRDYDPARPVAEQFPGSANSAGWLTRIGPNELLMVLDARPGRFEVYHLQR